jgi:hypothetical protein
MLKSYIKAGANIDGKTNSKETALHKCGRWDRKEAALYLLSLGANPSCKNGDGNKASDMTSDPEIKFLLDNYEEYLILEEQRRKDKQARSNNLALGIATSSQVSSRLYDSSINSKLSIDMNAILNASPKKSKSNTSSNNSINSKSSSSSRSPRSVTSFFDRK